MRPACPVYNFCPAFPAFLCGQLQDSAAEVIDMLLFLSSDAAALGPWPLFQGSWSPFLPGFLLVSTAGSSFFVKYLLMSAPHHEAVFFFVFFFTCSLPTGVESCGPKLWSNALERIRVQVTEIWINSQVFHPPPWLKQRKGRQLSWKAKAKALLKPRVELQVLISKTYSTLWESSVGTLMGEARNSQRREGGKRPGLAEPTGFWWMDAASASFLYIF